MRTSTFIVSLAVVVGATACNGAPEAVGFQSGTIAGASCPPGTEADGSCGGNDCGVACVATTTCASGEACPGGTACSTVDGGKWCMPKICKSKADCGSKESCETEHYTQGVCLPKGG